MMTSKKRSKRVEENITFELEPEDIEKAIEEYIRKLNPEVRGFECSIDLDSGKQVTRAQAHFHKEEREKTMTTNNDLPRTVLQDLSRKMTTNQQREFIRVSGLTDALSDRIKLAISFMNEGVTTLYVGLRIGSELTHTATIEAITSLVALSMELARELVDADDEEQGTEKISVDTLTEM